MARITGQLTVMMAVRSPDRWLAASWALLIASLLTVRRLDLDVLIRVVTMRAAVLVTILLAALSLALDPQFRQLLRLALTAGLLVTVVAASWLDGPSSVTESVLELSVPLTGYMVLGLFVARMLSSSLSARRLATRISANARPSSSAERREMLESLARRT